MNARTLWQVGGALIVLAVLVIGWFLVVQPTFAGITADEAELAAVEAQHEHIAADIEAMRELDVAALKAETRDVTTQLPGAFDEAAIYREVEAIVGAAGAELVRVAIAPPVEFVGVPSLAALPDGLAPANTPETLAAAAEAGLVVSTVAVEFNVATSAQSLDVMRGFAAAPRIALVGSGAIADAATQRLSVEMYFLPRDDDLQR